MSAYALESPFGVNQRQPTTFEPTPPSRVKLVAIKALDSFVVSFFKITDVIERYGRVIQIIFRTGSENIDRAQLNTYVKTALKIGYIACACFPFLIILPSLFAANRFNNSDLLAFARFREQFRSEAFDVLHEQFAYTKYRTLKVPEAICLCEVLLEKSLEPHVAVLTDPKLGISWEQSFYDRVARYCVELDALKIKEEHRKGRCEDFSQSLSDNAKHPTEYTSEGGPRRWDQEFVDEQFYYTSLKKDMEGRLAPRVRGPKLSDTQRFFMEHIILYCEAKLATYHTR